MEVLDFLQNEHDEHLKSKVLSALERVKRTIELYSPGGVAFSFNGGKDSTVLLHVIRAAAVSLSQSEQTNGHSNGLCGVHTFFFADPDDFQELADFVHDMNKKYSLQMEVFDGDFKTGLQSFIARTGVKAIFLGTRRGDPNAGGQEIWTPSSPGWPAFMRVNPIMDWAYPDVWAFLKHPTINAPYCNLYDAGYTSLGSIKNTTPNSALQQEDGSYLPAHLLGDSRLERAGRVPRLAKTSSGKMKRCGTASIAIIGDEILAGKVEDVNGHLLCQQLHDMGWSVTKIVMLPDDTAAISSELRRLAKSSDVVITAGGVGPTHDDVTIAAVADALNTNLVRNPDMEERIRNYFGDKLTDAHLKMAETPEGACELIDYTRQDGQPSPFPLMLCRNIYVLPGVPHLLKQKWKAVRSHLDSSALCQPWKSWAIRLRVNDEAAVAPVVSHVAAQAKGTVTIGSYPVSNQEDGATLVIALESKDEELLETAKQGLLGSLSASLVISTQQNVTSFDRHLFSNEAAAA